MALKPLIGLPGRGALTNVTGRFEPYEHVPFDDGWGSLDATPPLLRTTVTPERSRTILSRNDSPDVPFDVSINPYRGCEHGCTYCFARASHSFLNLSPGLDFESRLTVKPDAAKLLRRVFDKPDYTPQAIAIGTNTDPYQPVERRLGVTRELLEVFLEYRHPVSLVTKSHLVLRDLDLLAPLAEENLTAVFLSVTTLDRTLARSMEPRAPTPQRRLEALAGLSDAGVPTGVLASPMIPGLNDFELDRILEAAAGAGASCAAYMLLRLPHELKEVFTDWLETRHPTKAPRVLARLREMRGGKLYDSSFGLRMTGQGPQAELLRQRFELACRRFGLNRERPQLDVSSFRLPARPGEQGRLFD